MSRFQAVQQITNIDEEVITSFNSDPIPIVAAETFSAQCVVDVTTPSAKTFDSGVASSLEVQDLTYTADLRGVDGDDITIEYIGDGTAGAETVDVTTTHIVVHMDPTAVTGSTATQIKTAVDASVPASALISVAITGTGSNVQAVAAETPLEGGVDSGVNIDDDEVTIPDHGFITGLKGQLTTTGTLPGGLSLATDYFIIVVDADTVAFASTLVNALAGTKIDITNQGANASVNTFTATSIAGGTVKLQKSNAFTVLDLADAANWSDEGSATNITADATIWLEKVNPTGLYMRLAFAITAGSFDVTSQILAKGPN